MCLEPVRHIYSHILSEKVTRIFLIFSRCHQEATECATASTSPRTKSHRLDGGCEDELVQNRLNALFVVIQPVVYVLRRWQRCQHSTSLPSLSHNYVVVAIFIKKKNRSNEKLFAATHFPPPAAMQQTRTLTTSARCSKLLKVGRSPKGGPERTSEMGHQPTHTIGGGMRTSSSDIALRLSYRKRTRSWIKMKWQL